MIKQIILAVLIFTAGHVFGGQYVECKFSENDQTIGARLDDESAEEIYNTVSSAFEAQRESVSSSGPSAPEWRCGFGTDLRCP